MVVFLEKYINMPKNSLNGNIIVVITIYKSILKNKLNKYIKETVIALKFPFYGAL